MVLAASVTLADATDTTERLGRVAGSLRLHQLPGGTFTVDAGVLQYRNYPAAGTLWRVNDQRVAGFILSDWNWDVHAGGGRPAPAWGTMTISADYGTWEGTFSGIRRSDFEPVDLRASLLGEGAYDGLVATLDITATGMSGDETWIVDGVVLSRPPDG